MFYDSHHETARFHRFFFHFHVFKEYYTMEVTDEENLPYYIGSKREYV